MTSIVYDHLYDCPEDRASALCTHAREFSSAAREQITRKLSEACGPGSQRMCIIFLQSTISSPYGHTYTRMYTYENILPLGETDRIWLAPKNTDYGMPKSVTVFGRTFPVSDPWKSTASERPSNAIESLGGRARVQIAATLICG